MNPSTGYLKGRFILFLAIILIGSGYLNSITDIDKLKARLNKVSGQEKVSVLNELAAAYFPDFSHKGLDYAFQALSLAKEISDRMGMSNALLHIGKVYLHLNEFDKALEYCLKSLSLKEEISDIKGVSLCLDRIGAIYINLRDYDTALKYQIRSKIKAEETDDQELISQTLNSIGVNYWYQKEYEQALAYFQKSRWLREKIDDKMGLSSVLNNIGVIYNEKKDFRNALKYYMRSLNIKEEIDYQTGIATTLINIGEVYGALKNYSQALRYMTRSMKLAQQIKAKNILRNSYKYLSQLYQEMGNLQKALEYYKLYSMEKDKIFNDRISQTVAEMQAKYETEKKEKEIAKLEHEKELQSLELIANKQFRNFLTVGSSLALIFIILILRAYYHIRKKNELLKGSEERYRAVIEQSNECIYLVELYSRRILEVNQAFLDLIGYKREEILNMIIYDFLAHNRKDIDEKIQKIVRYGGANLGERRYRRQDGTIVDAEVRVDLIRYSGKEVMCVVARNITERKKSEEKIRASLKEKELLLKEIHHRVKNNMQIVSSLLSLQSKRIKNKETLVLFKESQSRIESMALIHETLYRSKDLAEIDASEYIKRLASSLFSNYGINDARINLEMGVDHIKLGIDKMLPFGLILNELITNALKHAFPDNRTGAIQIFLSRSKGDSYRLVVSDNGVGIPGSFYQGKANSLGLRLIHNLVEQINGEIEISNEGGTNYEIRFS